MVPEDIAGYIENLHGRFAELEAALADPAIYARGAECRRVSQEHRKLETLFRKFDDWRKALAGLADNREMLTAETDAELRELIAADIAELETPEERAEFLEELGLEQSGVTRLIRAAYSLLGLRTYFTAGPDEVRAWTFRQGTKAPQAAGIIHTDFEKGFIRANVIKYDDYITLGSESAVRDAGRLSVEGKDYVVQDGDIMHFLFNV